MAIEDLELKQLDIKDGIPTWRLGRRHLYVSTGKLHNDGGGRSPRMSIKEKHVWLKTIAEDVVLEIWYLHSATRLLPVRLRPMYVYSTIGKRVPYLSNPICQRHAHCRDQSSIDRKTKAEPSRKICESWRNSCKPNTCWEWGSREWGWQILSDSPNLTTFIRCGSASAWRTWSQHRLRYQRWSDYRTKTLLR